MGWLPWKIPEEIPPPEDRERGQTFSRQLRDWNRLMEMQHLTPMNQHLQFNDHLARSFGGKRQRGVISSTVIMSRAVPLAAQCPGVSRRGGSCLTERYRWECVRLPQDLGAFPIIRRKSGSLSWKCSPSAVLAVVAP